MTLSFRCGDFEIGNRVENICFINSVCLHKYHCIFLDSFHSDCRHDILTFDLFGCYQKSER